MRLFGTARFRFGIGTRYGVIALGFLFVPGSGTAANEVPASRASFEGEIRPLLKQYCFPCHSTEKHKGDFDMERFSSQAEVKRHAKTWENVTGKLANIEMPPEGKPQPTAEEKGRISSWLLGVLGEVAQERAGDPGPVVLRRLSNAEYTYT